MTLDVCIRHYRQPKPAIDYPFFRYFKTRVNDNADMATEIDVSPNRKSANHSLIILTCITLYLGSTPAYF